MKIDKVASTEEQPGTSPTKILGPLNIDHFDDTYARHAVPIINRAIMYCNGDPQQLLEYFQEDGFQKMMKVKEGPGFADFFNTFAQEQLGLKFRILEIIDEQAN